MIFKRKENIESIFFKHNGELDDFYIKERFNDFVLAHQDMEEELLTQFFFTYLFLNKKMFKLQSRYTVYWGREFNLNMIFKRKDNLTVLLLGKTFDFKECPICINKIAENVRHYSFMQDENTTGSFCYLVIEDEYVLKRAFHWQAYTFTPIKK